MIVYARFEVSIHGLKVKTLKELEELRVEVDKAIRKIFVFPEPITMMIPKDQISEKDIERIIEVWKNPENNKIVIGDDLVRHTGDFDDDIEVETIEHAGEPTQTCQNCKHYDVKDKVSGSCSNSKFVGGYGHKFVKDGEDRDLCDVPVDGVMLEDDEGWGFFVGKDFCCIHFEEKE
jgi:hypothetical protein